MLYISLGITQNTTILVYLSISIIIRTIYVIFRLRYNLTIVLRIYTVGNSIYLTPSFQYILLLIALQLEYLLSTYIVIKLIKFRKTRIKKRGLSILLLISIDLSYIQLGLGGPFIRLYLGAILFPTYYLLYQRQERPPSILLPLGNKYRPKGGPVQPLVRIDTKRQNTPFAYSRGMPQLPTRLNAPRC